jgi:hypothetical protein
MLATAMVAGGKRTMKFVQLVTRSAMLPQNFLAEQKKREEGIEGDHQVKAIHHERCCRAVSAAAQLLAHTTGSQGATAQCCCHAQFTLHHCSTVSTGTLHIIVTMLWQLRVASQQAHCMMHHCRAFTEEATTESPGGP